MEINSDLYLHPTDKAALKALKSIPGFSTFIKAFMSLWDERQFRIMNMSTNLRLSDKQMKKYHDMLLPICNKLGIDVPELYIELDVYPNAYTFGDKNPFIVVTSALFETVPEELIPTVLAHECGHIACHHSMYTTMGRLILNGAYNFLPGLASLVSVPLQIAFAYWMRCSEYSADRVATICDGTSDKIIEMCMRFAGYDKDINAEGNVDAFMEQAEEYLELVKNDAWNKTIEFLRFNQNTHPLNAVRAYECREWGKSEQYRRICSLLDNKDNFSGSFEIPTNYSSKDYLEMPYASALDSLKANGFTNCTLIRDTAAIKKTNEQQVTAIAISGNDSFNKFDWFANDSAVEIHYYLPETMDEKIQAHGGKHCLPDSSKRYIGRNLQDVINEFSEAGFLNINTEAQKTRKTLFVKDETVVQITINGLDTFEKDEWIEPDADIRIAYVQII